MRGRSRDGGVDDPASGLDRPHPAHLQVLVGRGGEAVGSVVDRHHDEGRPSTHVPAEQRREAVLEADRGPERRERSEVERPWAVARHPVHGHLVDRADPTEAVPPRHVFAERHEVGLVVAIHHRAVTIEGEDARALAPVVEVHHGARHRGRAHGGDDLTDGGGRGRIGRGRRIEGPLPPHHEIGGVPRQRAMQVHESPCDDEVLLDTGRPFRHADVDLRRGDVELRTVRLRERDRDREEHERDREEGAARASPCPSPAGEDLRQERVDRDHDEGHPPHAGHRGERQEEPVVDLGVAEPTPAESTERPGGPHEVDEGPQRGDTEGVADRMPRTGHEGKPEAEQRDRQTHQEGQRDPRELAEPGDPVDDRAVGRQPVGQADEEPACRARGAEQDEEGHDRDERQRPRSDRREGEGQDEPAADRHRQRDREPRARGHRLTRNRDSASASCPPAGCDASRGSNSCT